MKIIEDSKNFVCLDVQDFISKIQAFIDFLTTEDGKDFYYVSGNEWKYAIGAAILKGRPLEDLQKIALLSFVVGPEDFLMYGYAMNYKKDLQIVDYLQERGFEFLPLDKLGEAERILAWGYVHEAAQLIGEKTYKHYRDDHFLTPRGQYLQHKFGPISTECFDTLIKGDEVEIHTPEDGFTKYVGKYVRHKNGNSEHNDDNVGYVVLDIDGKKTKIRGDLIYEAINCKTGAALKKPSECFDRNEFSKYMTMFE